MKANIYKQNCHICKQYIRQIKALFPVIGQKEKKYLDSYHFYSFCSDDTPITLDDFYTEYGKPEEIFSAYLSVMNTGDLVKHFKKLTIAKKILICIIVAAWIILLLCVIKTYNNYKNYESVLNSMQLHWVDEIE